MSQVLLFAIGTCVFTITLLTTLFYGYFTFNRLYGLSIAEEESVVPTFPESEQAAPEWAPAVVAS